MRKRNYLSSIILQNLRTESFVFQNSDGKSKVYRRKLTIVLASFQLSGLGPVRVATPPTHLAVSTRQYAGAFLT